MGFWKTMITLAALLISIQGGSDDVPKNEYYFPFVGLTESTRCIAWYHWNNDFAVLRQLDAGCYYNDSSFMYGMNGKALPIVTRGNIEDAAPYLGMRFRDCMLILNEPERAGAITPAEAIDFAYLVMRHSPNAPCFVGPNVAIDSIGIEWLSEFAELGGMEMFDHIGIHVYPLGDVDPNSAADQACVLVAGNCDIWITEVGYPVGFESSEETFREWVQQIESNDNISRYFAYTAWKGCCDRELDLIAPDENGNPGNLSPTGRAWVYWED